MNTPIPITLAAEDELSETVLRVILDRSSRRFAVGQCLRRGGNTYLKSIVNGLNKAARSTPYLLLTDLDRSECPPALIQDWLTAPRHPNLIFRVAVREVEAWVLAHKQAFASFFGVPEVRIPDDVDAIHDPKEFLINLMKRSKKRRIREDIVPPPGSTAKVGPNYNEHLCQFVETYWDKDQAKQRSRSLERSLQMIEKFAPTWP